MKANIKIFITALVLLIFVGNIYAQKGIGTNNPEPSSVLDLTSTTKGFLIPRMTTLQRTNLPSPAEGLQVYDTDTHTHWFYNGSIWTESNLWSKSGTNISPAILGDDLLLNTGETFSISDMTRGSVPFIGSAGLITQDNNSLFWEAEKKRLGIGTNNPDRTLDVIGNAKIRNTVIIHTKETYESEDLGVKLEWNLLQTQETNDPNDKKYPTIVSGNGYEGMFPLTRWKMGDEDQYGIKYGYVGFLPHKPKSFRINTGGKATFLVLGAMGVDAIHILGNGKVGIGTDNPEELVHIAKNMQLDGHFVDGGGDPGTSGYLLSATASGTKWIDAHLLQDGTGTDDQNISGSGLLGTTLTIGIENGTNETVDLSSLSTNIFNSNGTLTGNRTLTGGGNSLSLTSLSGFGATTAAGTFQLDANATWTDARAVGSQNGIEYAANYSADYTNRSLVDKEYVDFQMQWEIVGDMIRPKNNSVRRVFVEENSNSYTQFKVVNTNDAGNMAGAIIELKGSGADYTNNMYIGKYGSSFWIPELTGNGAVLTDRNLVIGTASASQEIHFVTGNSYSDLKPVVVADNQGFRYTSDLSATFVPRTLVDKQYVDDAVVAAGNIYGTNGTLTGDRVVSALDYSLSFVTEDESKLEISTDEATIEGQVVNINTNTLKWNPQYGSNAAVPYPTGNISTDSILVINPTTGYFGLVNPGSLSTNIFNTNGTLTGNRTLTGGGNSLSLTTLSGFGATTAAGTFQLDANATWTDARAVGSQNGIEYAADYSADFTNRSLVDKEYVDTQITTHVSPWTKTGTNVSPTTLGDDVLLNTGETLSITDMTQGSVPFIGASGLITQNNSQLFWDAANNRLGIGTTSPTSAMHIKSSNSYEEYTVETASNVAYFGLNDNSSDSYIYINGSAAQPHSILLSTGVSAHSIFLQKGTGYVGFGDITPQYRLHVDGTIAPKSLGMDLGTSTLKWDAHLNDVDAVTVTTDEMTINDLLVAPKLALAPATPTAGQIYYDTATNKLRCYDGTIWNDLF